MLEKKSPEKITTMLEALVGLLRNSENCTNRDVEVYLLKIMLNKVIFIKARRFAL